MTKFARKIALLVAPLALGAATAAQAGGFYLEEQSVRDAGRAFAGAGADTGTQSLWWNPAAIAGTVGLSGHIGASGILPAGNVVNTGTTVTRPVPITTPVGGQQVSADPISNGLLPSGGIAYGLNDRLAIGVVVTSPFSFTTNYDSNSWVRYSADKTYLRTADIQPSIAFQVIPGFSIGAAANVEYSYATLSNFLPNVSPLQPDGHQGLKGHGWDVGYTVGAQFHQGPLSLGASYKSSIKHTLDGSLTNAGVLAPLSALVPNATTATKASFRTPWQITGSIRYAVTPRLTLDGQVSRIGWNKFDAIRIAAPFNTTIPENYRNTWAYSAGFDYAATRQITLRAGVQRDLTPTQNGQRDARVPDANRWYYTAGTSIALNKAVTVDAAVGYIDFKDATIDRQTSVIGSVVNTNGRLENANAMVLSLGGRFAF